MKATIKKLLSEGKSNTKTKKNVLPTYILYLSPYRENDKGINICPKASEGCRKSCLFTAGLASVFNSVNIARRRKTEYYLSNRQAFCEQLVKELRNIDSKGIKTAIRLNGTSDLDFIGIVKNRLNVDLLGFKNLRFYDYTKIKGKVEKYAGTKYMQTFSRSETNEGECLELLSKGFNVSVVFNHKLPMPKVWKGYKVVNGDAHDDLMLKHKGVVIGLKAKGKARKDVTGFVICD